MESPEEIFLKQREWVFFSLMVFLFTKLN